MSRDCLHRSVLMASLILAAPVAAQTAPGDQDRDADNRDVIVVGSQSDRGVATSGTKTELPVAQTPQSISVVTSDDIAGLGLQNLNQVLRFVAGVTTEQRGSSAEVYDQFKLRGFDAPQFLDGLRLIGGASYLAPQVDVSLLDRVEVLKGPASVLYGQSGPGGLVALSSKMPLDRDMYGAIAGTYGTYDLYRIDADIGGRAGGDVLWRLYGSANGADTQQRFSKRVRQTVGGAVTAGAGTATSFTLIGRYSHDPDNGAYGVFPASGTFLTNPNGRLSTKFDAGEAGNRFQREQAAVSYIFNHDFGGGWALRSAGRYEHGTSQLGLVYANGTLLASDPTQQTFGRSSYATRENSNAWTYDTQLRGHVSTGPVEHTLLFGVDRQVGHGYSDYAFGSGTPLNGYAPVYGTMPVPQTPATVPDPFAGTSRLRARQQGLYAQDQISVGGLRVLLGGRQDWAQTGSAGQDLQHSRKFTYRAGALYTTSIGIAPYVSYSTSFEPQTGTVSDPNGTTDVPKPSQGKQIEAGIKYQVPNTSILLTGAWFRIEQTNLLTPIPNTPFAIQTGKVRSQGVEVEAVAPLPYGFNARLAFSRQKVRTIADENPANIGKGILGVGRGGTSANLEWAPQSGALSGFAIGGAVRHVDRVYAGTYFDASANAPDHTPSYTLFDALARYDLGKAFSGMQGVTLSVNATNLFDKKYITTCYLDYGWCWYGNRRTVQGTIGVRF